MRIAFVVNNAAFFASHRLPIAVRAIQEGHEVLLLTGQAGSATLEPAALTRIEAAGVRHRALPFHSNGMNPLRELWGMFALMLALRKYRPEVVHCVSPKGILYGGLAARCIFAPALVLAVSGMGYLFTGPKRGLRRWVGQLYTGLAQLVYGHRNKRAIVQNLDDWQSLLRQGLASEDELVLIPGSGVPLDRFAPGDEQSRQNIVLLPARLLRDKGVLEFVAAARWLRVRGCTWRFVLVGTADYRNPTAIAAEEVQAWVAEGCVEWWGHRDDMEAVFARARIVCLPSYREGMPKALLEAAAAGCAVVTTDVVGCREAIEPGITGDMVPAQDAVALATALGALIDDPERQRRYAVAGRARAVARFGVDAVVARTLALYEELRQLSTAPARKPETPAP